MTETLERTTPAALQYSTENCQIGRALETLGEKGAFIVLREAFNGITRFDDMQRHSGLSRQVLSNRLALLVDQGILRRNAYQDNGSRTRHDYRLTGKGIDLYPTLAALSDWGARYCADADGPAVQIAHRGCGGQVHAALVCDVGHPVAAPRDVAPQPGPGARRVMAQD